MSCRACLAGLLKQAKRVHSRALSSYPPRVPPPPGASSAEQPAASTSRLPGTPSTWLPSPVPPAVQDASKTSPEAEPSSRAPSTPLHSTNDLKTKIIRLLESRKGRAALRLFLASLAKPIANAQPDSVHGHAWLFLTYGRPELALEAVEAMHQRGYKLGQPLCVKLLQTARHELVLRPDKLTMVIGWIRDGITGDAAAGMEIDADLVATALNVLKRMGRGDWAVGIFEAYCGTLPEKEVGATPLWSSIIGVMGIENNVDGARDYFHRWRQAWFKQHPFSQNSFIPPRKDSAVGTTRDATTARGAFDPSPTTASPTPATSLPTTSPPEEPYLALLGILTHAISSVPAKQDFAYRFLPILHRDGVELSVNIFNALLRLELYRKRYSSFWGLWRTMAEGSWSRNQRTWKLAINAKVWRDTTRRQRGRKHTSPLQELAGYTNGRAPSSRDLFRQYLTDHHAQTKGRPALTRPTAQSPLMTTEMLNSFLSLFVAIGDWRAATVVLESYGVHRVEPNQATHGAVVVGVVKWWEKGKLRGELEEEYEIEGMERRRASVLDGSAGMEMISKILEERKMRVGLWATPPVPGLESEEGELLGQEPIGTNPPPVWMVRRELRELGYLVSLLRRCEGLDEVRWGEQMAEVRREILPKRKASGLEEEEV